jgi:hypothetical protein
VHEGNIAAWLLAARAMIHNGCTTAVEAAVLGVPAFAFQPVKSELFDTALPNQLSARARTEEELLELLNGVSRGEYPGAVETWQQLLQTHISGLDGPLCCERMLNSLSTLTKHGFPDHAIFRRASALVLSRIERVVRETGEQVFGLSQTNRYRAHKFPPVTAETINKRISALSGALYHFGRCKARPIAPNLFEIYDTGC